MNTYIVYLTKTNEKIASGTSAECAKKMGLSGVRSFHQTAADVRDGKNEKYKITVFSSGKIDGLTCPCDSCEHQPPNKPKWAASWGCESLCGNWEKWAKRYWKQINKKYGGRKCGRE